MALADKSQWWEEEVVGCLLVGNYCHVWLVRKRDQRLQSVMRANHSSSGSRVASRSVLQSRGSAAWQLEWLAKRMGNSLIRN